MSEQTKGTCCEKCEQTRNIRGEEYTDCCYPTCTCHTAPPPPNTSYEIALCEKCVQLTNHLNGMCQKCFPTPNTGTEWESQFNEIVKNLMRTNNDRLFSGQTTWIKDFIREALATQKSQLIAEVEGMKWVDDGQVEKYDKENQQAFYNHNKTLDDVITKLKEM